MKKLLCLLTIMLLLCMLVLPSFAVDASPPLQSSEIAESYMSWEFLGSMAGVTAAVLLIVQFLKAPLDKIWKVPTRFIVYLISLLILLAVENASKGFIAVDRIFLLLLNAIIVTISAMGAYEATFHRLELKNQT